MPKSRTATWAEKFAANIERDARQLTALRSLGWRVLVVWECEIKNEVAVEHMLAALTGRGGAVSKRESSGLAATADSHAATHAAEEFVRFYPTSTPVEPGSRTS